MRKSQEGLMKSRQSIALLLAALFLVGSNVALSQDQSHTLTINGQPGSVPVILMNGRSYVDLEALARVVNGSLTFSGSQISLTLPGGPATTPASAATTTATPSPQSNPGFSQGFMRAGIEEMATIREWHSALASAVQNGFPMVAGSFAPYRSQAATNLRLASLAVSTNSDRGAYQLLTNVFQNLANLTDKYVAARANMNFISPDALDRDDLNQRIVNCGHSLASMAASGQFVDDGSCH
jgi:hypothetical protein